MHPSDLEEFYKVLESIASSIEKLNQNISALLGIQSQIVAQLAQIKGGVLAQVEPPKPLEDQDKLMISKYKGTCTVCHKPINQGDPIVYSKSKGARHQTCPR
jgi:hypothetical protein